MEEVEKRKKLNFPKAFFSVIFFNFLVEVHKHSANWIAPFLRSKYVKIKINYRNPLRFFFVCSSWFWSNLLVCGSSTSMEIPLIQMCIGQNEKLNYRWNKKKRNQIEIKKLKFKSKCIFQCFANASDLVVEIIERGNGEGDCDNRRKSFVCSVSFGTRSSMRHTYIKINSGYIFSFSFAFFSHQATLYATIVVVVVALIDVVIYFAHHLLFV